MDEEAVDYGCLGSAAPCNPHNRLHRFLVLILICLLAFGSYFCYDNPAALAQQFKNDLNLEGTDFMLLYSLYSWPNVFLCFFGGYLIDRVFGIRLGAFIFGFVIMVGQIIFALGAYLDSKYVMYAGRFVFGLGGENLAVAGNTYVVSWFAGKEINTVFGINLSFSRIGSTVGMNVMGPIYDALSESYKDNKPHLMGILLMIGAGLCLFSLLCSVLLAVLDMRAARILKKEVVGAGETVKLSDITRFPFPTWMIFFVCVFYYVAIFPFVSLGKLFFEEKYGLSQAQAGVCNSLIYFIGAGASPLAGMLLDLTGRNLMWLFLAMVISLFSYSIMAFTFITPYFPMAMMAIAYSICASALWPMVSLVVPEYQLGTAYGAMQSIQNLGLALVSPLAGSIEAKYGYFYLMIQFMGWLALATVCVVVLWAYDNRVNDGYLNASPARRRAMNALEVQTALDREDVHRPLLDDGSVMDYSTSLRGASAKELRHRYTSKLGPGSSRNSEFEASVNLTQSYQISSIANPTILK